METKELPGCEPPLEFVLKVKACKKNGTNAIDLDLDLNPTFRIIGPNEAISHPSQLRSIFEFVIKLIDDINDRTLFYQNGMEASAKRMVAQGSGEAQESDAARSRGIGEEYISNCVPDFGKIDKIRHQQKSPGTTNVSYVRTYNGDMKPPKSMPSL